MSGRSPALRETNLNEARNRIEIGIYPLRGAREEWEAALATLMSHAKPLSSRLDVRAYTHGPLDLGSLQTKRSSAPSTTRLRWRPRPLTERRWRLS